MADILDPQEAETPDPESYIEKEEEILDLYSQLLIGLEELGDTSIKAKECEAYIVNKYKKINSDVEDAINDAKKYFFIDSIGLMKDGLTYVKYLVHLIPRIRNGEVEALVEWLTEFILAADEEDRNPFPIMNLLKSIAPDFDLNVFEHELLYDQEKNVNGWIESEVKEA